MSYKKLILIIALIFISIQNKYVSAASYIWTQKASYPGNGWAYGCAFVLKGKGYYGTGQTNNILYKDFYRYDPATNSWTKLANYGGSKRIKGVGFSIAPYGFIGTGQDDIVPNTFYNDCWRYDPALDSWSQIAGLPEGRAEAIAFSVKDSAYIGMGTSTNGNDMWRYDPNTNNWYQVADFPNMHAHASAVFSYLDKAWVCCGNVNGNASSDVWMYNASTNTWTQKSSFVGMPRSKAVAFDIDGQGYVGLGSNGNTEYKDFYRYDRFLDKWDTIPDFPDGARQGTSSFSIGDFGYVLGGHDVGQYYDDMWSFGPADSIVDSTETFCIVDVFPLATKSNLKLECENAIDKTLTFMMYDMAGRLITTQSYKMTTTTLQLSLGRYREGIYVYTVSCDNLFVTSGKLAIIQ